MGNTHITGRTISVKQPARVIYAIFSDLRNFATNLPAEVKDKAELSAESDWLLAKVQGFEMGIKVAERSPFNFVRFEQYGSTPISFNFWVRLDIIDEHNTAFHLELDAELGTMMKMMVGGKLKEMIDKLTDELERGFSSIPTV